MEHTAIALNELTDRIIGAAIHVHRTLGPGLLESAYEACRTRFRPILMTTMCAMLGGVPLMIGAGTGAELRQPLGFAMVGGLIVSQLMTLFTTPVVYIYLDGLTRWLARQRAKYWPARRGQEPPHAATTAS